MHRPGPDPSRVPGFLFARDNAPVIAVGMMSGTSADGIDLAAIELQDADVRLVATSRYEYPGELRERILRAAAGDPLDAIELSTLHTALGDHYADAAAALVAKLARTPDVIAVHGQTVAHVPARHSTLQLGDASRVAIRTGVATVSDFRSADMAAGGEGAPLVPFADWVLFATRAPVVLLNLGGIANLTLMPTERKEDVIAFDTGPANMVSDLIARRAGRRFDDRGQGAARGFVDDAALTAALAHPYFARRSPKSTGREEFGQPFADDLAQRVAHNGGTHDDMLATAIALTVRTVADGLARESPRGASWRELIVAGGGALNLTLVARLRDAIAPLVVRTMDELGIPVASREAVAFAILGAYRMRGLANTLPSATGAKRAVSGGAVHQP
jgi:anhydro-N-acetylmuramic acid kinase